MKCFDKELWTETACITLLSGLSYLGIDANNDALLGLAVSFDFKPLANCLWRFSANLPR